LRREVGDDAEQGRPPPKLRRTMVATPLNPLAVVVVGFELCV
jgi:hypothetical protein